MFNMKFMPWSLIILFYSLSAADRLIGHEVKALYQMLIHCIWAAFSNYILSGNLISTGTS